MSDRLREAILTAGGLGRLWPSGTWGSALVPAMVAILLAAGAPGAAIDVVLAATALAFAAACVAWGAWAEGRYGKDPGRVVADEVAGQSLALLFLPWRELSGGCLFDAALLATGFVAFRAFDVVKPPPARQLERLGGGWGILLDDLAAGIYALAVTQAAARVIAGAVFPQAGA